MVVERKDETRARPAALEHRTPETRDRCGGVAGPTLLVASQKTISLVSGQRNAIPPLPACHLTFDLSDQFLFLPSSSVAFQLRV